MTHLSKNNSFFVILNFPPSRNHTHFRSKWTGGEVPNKIYRKWMEDAKRSIKMEKKKNQLATFDCVSITYKLYWPNNYKADADNRLKVVRDALCSEIIKDDNWKCIREEHIYNYFDKEFPRIEIQISPALEMQSAEFAAANADF